MCILIPMLATSTSESVEQLQFLTDEQARAIAQEYGSPVYVYDEATLLDRSRQAIAFKAPYGLTVRYAMKANPLTAILRLFDSQGIHIDASSGFEAHRAILAGIAPDHIMITSQQLPKDLRALVEQGVRFNATSLHQLDTYGQLFPGTNVAIRVNIGFGSGHSRSVSVAGETSSFGIWHRHIDEIQALLRKHRLNVKTIHSHIGCGTDPAIWHRAAQATLRLIEHFPEATNLNLGGGFKVARLANETATDLGELSRNVSDILIDFESKTHRKLHLEIEPGTFLVANAGALISRVQDIANTGDQGLTFLKLDTGMNDLMRPALYGSQHPLILIGSHSPNYVPYVVVGHNCESTDLLTPDPNDSEVPLPRLLPEAQIGNLMVIEGVGAYCAAMSVTGYNSFPSPNEIMLETSGQTRLVNRSQGVAEFTASELA
jgi:diaminopimelate decarboxylase